MTELQQGISRQTLDLLKGYNHTNISKTHLYNLIVDEHPEYLDQTTPSTIKRHITKTLLKNGFKNTSKTMNWFVRE
jgi:hypothetical protein